MTNVPLDFNLLFLRLLHFTFIPGMMVLTFCYAGSLVSFFSVDVYPRFPATTKQLEVKVRERDQNVIVCCDFLLDVMENSLDESYRALASKVYSKPSTRFFM